MMKDYLSYQLMAGFGVDAPLSSFAYVTVNGEDWGLYLAVEGVEDAFLERTHDSEGELYKPDSMEMGGGRGNGRDFDMNAQEQESEAAVQTPADMEAAQDPTAFAGGQMPMQMPEGMQGQMPGGRGPMPGQMPQGMGGSMPGGRGQMAEGMPGGGMGGNGSADVKLQYIDDDPDSYSNIFGNAKTDVTTADKSRLIASLKALSAGQNIPEIVDVDQVMRYFVVHSFLCNGDSYTGGMIHNYYLYENQGKLSMIPWDYNLAFGGFQSFDATSTVNDPIDSPVSGGSVEDRPMIAWVFDEGTYQAQYHALYEEFLQSADIAALIDPAAELIAPYVERDPTKFCTYEEFTRGVETLRAFCSLRTESIKGQLDGTIPSTTEGQNTDSSTLIDASQLVISDMGSMEQGMGMMRGGFGERTQMPEGEQPQMDFSPQNGKLPEDGFMPSDGGPMLGERESMIGPQAWIILGICGAVLLLGLLLTRLFRRK